MPYFNPGQNTASDIRRGEIRGDNPSEIRRVRLGVIILLRLGG